MNAYGFASLGLLLIAAACSSRTNQATRFVKDDAVSPCENELQALCGTACSEAEACPEGTFCQTGMCTAECSSSGNQCASGASCDASSGRCVASNAPSEGGLDVGMPGGDAGTSTGDTCIDVNVEFERLTPTVMLLLDKSDSMNRSFGADAAMPVSRWQSMGQTLFDPADGIVQALQNSVRFGMALYTSIDGSEGGRACPLLDEVPIALDNFMALSNTFDMAVIESGSDTPTAESVAAVANTLTAFQEAGPKSIILATDGEPDTCEDPDAQEASDERQAAAREASVSAVTNAFTRGITTHVISVGNDIAALHLQDLANAGAGVESGAEYYQALNKQQLVDAFQNIISGVTNCIFNLNGRVDSSQADQGAVSLNGTPLDYMDENGWRLSSPEAVELLGTACDAVKGGAGDTLRISFPCGIFTVVR